MELVNINLSAEGYYSGSTYKYNILIKKSSYEKLMDIFPEEISCGELDGKKWSLRDLYESNGLDWVEEQKEIKEYLSHLGLYEEVTMSVMHSKVKELMKFVDNL